MPAFFTRTLGLGEALLKPRRISFIRVERSVLAGLNQLRTHTPPQLRALLHRHKAVGQVHPRMAPGRFKERVHAYWAVTIVLPRLGFDRRWLSGCAKSFAADVGAEGTLHVTAGVDAVLRIGIQ